jgi:hypothetical protein
MVRRRDARHHDRRSRPRAVGAWRLSWINIDAPAFNALALTRIAGLPLDALPAGMASLPGWRCAGPSRSGRLHAVGDNPSQPGSAACRSVACAAPLTIACGRAGVGGILAGARTGWSALDRYRPGILGDCRRGARRRRPCRPDV